MTASAPLMMEIVEAAPRRRRWSQVEKEQLVAETCEPGVSVSLVARRRGVDPSLLFRWRRQMLTPAEPPPLFAPVEVADATPVLSLTPPAPSGAGMIEIELAGGRRLRVGRDVDAEALRRVVSVLERP
ncbi:IS66-like element accessory protein TnpA [Azospirillum brasilense]|uniref:IS66-like element accessory protein TnpA n=1 Tax=Azospirillum brasilense TaxID=192 RepID=UPI003AF79501|nr:transposase [Azospirillum brasilense]